MSRGHYRCTYEMACNILWAVYERGWSQTKTALVIGLNVGTVCHVVHRRRFPNAYPKPIPGY